MIVGVIGAVAVVVAAYFLFLGPAPTPAGKFRALLSGHKLEKPNIVFITLDTTRADRLHCYGNDRVQTPFLDQVADDGILFEQCITPSGLTLPSHSSMMTGLHPTYHGVRINGHTALSQQHTTLAELLGEQGYQCGAFIAAFVLDGRWGLKQGFHHYDDQFDLKKYKRLDLGHVQRGGEEMMDLAIDWMDQHKGKPFFSWIHLYDPHTPYEPPEPFLSRYQNGEMSGLYDGEIAYTDTHIGRCLDWLKTNGLEENTILVIMGDHGEGLGDHGEMTHGYYIYDYTVHVPFLMKTPFDSLRGVRVPTQVSTVDLYPTLLEMLNLPVPEAAQGRSLLPLMFGEEPETEAETYAYSESMTPNIQYGWSPLHSLRTGKYKYIDAPRPELYDLTKDPREHSNLYRRLPQLAEKYKAALKQIMDQTSEGAPEPEAANLDQETLKRLATLGYIGGTMGRTVKKGVGLADPKDKLEIFEKISLAGEHINREKREEAAGLLEAVLAEDSNIPQAKLLLATCYVEMKRPGEAKVLLDALLKEDPNNLQALISMANVLMDEGKGEDVITICKKAIAVDERNTQAHILIGEVFMDKKDHEQAYPYISKAVEIQPKLTRNRQNLAACLVGLKRYGEAETMLKDIIQKNPKFPTAHFHLGLLYEEQDRFDDARAAYEEEIEIHSGNVPARFNLGKLLFKARDLEGYIEQMREVTSLAPKMAEGHLFLARGLMYQNADPDVLLETVQKGLEVAKSARMKAFGHFLLADVYSRKKQPQRVQEALAQANRYKQESEKEKN